jgi:hypothetical protein
MAQKYQKHKTPSFKIEFLLVWLSSVAKSVDDDPKFVGLNLIASGTVRKFQMDS